MNLQDEILAIKQEMAQNKTNVALMQTMLRQLLMIQALIDCHPAPETVYARYRALADDPSAP